MKKISNLLLLVLLTLGMGLTSCDEQLDNAVTPVVDEKGEVTSIEVDLSKIDEKYLDTEKTKLQLTVGDEVELSFTILPEEVADTEVELTAADATILSIEGLKVKALKAGETKVTAKAGDKTATCTVTVSKKAASISFAVTAINKTVGDAAFKNAPTIEGDGTVESYSSSDTDVATVATDGTVTIKGAGSTTITVKVANGAKNSYSPNTASYTLTVAKKAGSISYTTTEIGKSVGDAAFTNELTKVGDGSVSYASTNTAVATVNATTGEVTIVGAGTATITVTVADSDTYTYATTTASYTLTVSPAVKKLDPFDNGGNPLGS